MLSLTFVIQEHSHFNVPRVDGAPGRPAVENCGLRWSETAGAVGRSPRQGAWQTKPATLSKGRGVRGEGPGR